MDWYSKESYCKDLPTSPVPEIGIVLVSGAAGYIVAEEMKLKRIIYLVSQNRPEMVGMSVFPTRQKRYTFIIVRTKILDICANGVFPVKYYPNMMKLKYQFANITTS